MAGERASHVDPEDLGSWIQIVRESAERVGRDVPVLVDLPGIKFRIGDLDEPIDLVEGQIVRLGGEGPDRIPVLPQRLVVLDQRPQHFELLVAK